MSPRIQCTKSSPIDHWRLIRSTDGRHLLKVILHRIRHKIPRRTLSPSRWQGTIPDLRYLRNTLCSQNDYREYIHIAEEAIAGRLTLLGFPTFHLGDMPDWHTDPCSGYRWPPTAPSHSLDLMTRDSPADVRILWELNRFHHFIALGLAWQLTHDSRYLDTFVNQLRNWLETNPVGKGVNWASAMEVAIRAVNWLIAGALMQEGIPTEFQRTLLSALLSHGQFIRANLEIARITTNHYLANIAGLAVLGLALPGKEPTRWRRFALRELAREVNFQVYPDGVDFEASSSYHRLATELVALPIRLAHQMGIELPHNLAARQSLMEKAISCIARPDGTVPIIGDSDDGHLLPPYTRPHTPVPTSRSTAFPHAGIYIMRHNDQYLVCDCGTNGQRGNGGHAHNDTLSFELFSNGHLFITDPGCYSYTGDLTSYNWFRSTAAHNTLQIDEEEQASFSAQEPFLLGAEAVPVVNQWKTTKDYDFLDAEHYGYRRLSDPATHRRQILLDKTQRVWLVRDMVIGNGTHKLDWYFHFAPMKVGTDSNHPLVVRASPSSDTELLLLPLKDPGLNLTLETAWVSFQYGHREPAPAAHYALTRAELPVVLTFALVPTHRGIPVADLAQRIQQSVRILETTLEVR